MGLAAVCNAINAALAGGRGFVRLNGQSPVPIKIGDRLRVEIDASTGEARVVVVYRRSERRRARRAATNGKG